MYNPYPIFINLSYSRAVTTGFNVLEHWICPWNVLLSSARSSQYAVYWGVQQDPQNTQCTGGRGFSTILAIRSILLSSARSSQYAMYCWVQHDPHNKQCTVEFSTILTIRTVLRGSARSSQYPMYWGVQHDPHNTHSLFPTQKNRLIRAVEPQLFT
jgi:hypothetical protein